MINLDHAKKAFDNYVNRYDLSIPHIHLKYVHSYKVMDVMGEICDMKGKTEEKDLCLLIGLLHDIGRFEQFRLYHSFLDRETVDHAMYSSHVLFEEGLIRKFIEEDTYDTIIKHAIEQHNKYKVEEGFSEEELFYIHMIRDADKLDHFRVKDVEKDTVLLGVTYEEAGKESITDEDMWISYIAFIFDLYFDESKSYIEKNHYIERSFDKIKIEDLEILKKYRALEKCALEYIKGGYK